MILEPNKIKSAIVSTFFPFICHEVMRPDAMILVFCLIQCSWKLIFQLISTLVVGGLVAKSCPTLVIPWTVAYQTPCLWDSPGENTRVGCHFLLQRIFPTEESNPGLLHCGQILYRLSYKGSPNKYTNLGLIIKIFPPQLTNNYYYDYWHNHSSAERESKIQKKISWLKRKIMVRNWL